MGNVGNTSRPNATKPPLWTRLSFAWAVAIGLLLLARSALKASVVHARFKAAPLERLAPDNTRAVLLLIASMLLVIAAIVVPLIIRRKAHARLGDA